MSDEIREFQGIKAGDYTRSRGGTIHNTERNAIAYLLLCPWTKDLWSDGFCRLRDRRFPTVQDIDLTLIQAQHHIPSLTRAKIAAAIQILALANPQPWCDPSMPPVPPPPPRAA